jgi:hypothetical protein
MCRSSILSFESLAGVQPRVPATLLAVAGIVAAVEIGLRLVPEERLIPAKSRQGEIYFMEREVLPRFQNPQVVLLGSSRVRRAVVPKLLDERLGLPANATLNVGLASGRVFEALYLYERNRAQFKGAKLVVLNVDEWHLSSGWRLGSLYEMHAPWQERLDMPDGLRNRLVLDGVFSMRLRLRLLPGVVASAFGRRKADTLDIKLDENNQVLPPSRPPLPVDVDPRRFYDNIDTFYDHFAISPVLEGHVEKLARMVKEDGGRFVIMQLPNRAAYQAEVEKSHGKDYAQHVAALRALARRLDVPLAVIEQPSACGLTDESYEDYGHMTAAGARVFTTYFGDMVQRESWLKP